MPTDPGVIIVQLFRTMPFLAPADIRLNPYPTRTVYTALLSPNTVPSRGQEGPKTCYFFYLIKV